AEDAPREDARRRLPRGGGGGEGRGRVRAPLREGSGTGRGRERAAALARARERGRSPRRRRPRREQECAASKSEGGRGRPLGGRRGLDEGREPGGAVRSRRQWRWLRAPREALPPHRRVRKKGPLLLVGGAGGMGRLLARFFRARGFTVLVCDPAGAPRGFRNA